MIELSAPRQNGYEKTFETVAEARSAAADILGISVADMIEVGPVGGEDVTYCYATQADADDDQDGAYAVQYKEIHHALVLSKTQQNVYLSLKSN